MYRAWALFVLGVFSFCLISRAQVTVGSCQQAKNTYGTISAAISAISPGDVIDVCPGTYPEQLVINKPLTLQGIGLVSLTFPVSGLAIAPDGSGAFTQILIENTGGPVTLNYLSIEGADSFQYPYSSSPEIIQGESLCAAGLLQDYSGILSINPATTLTHLNVSGHAVAPEAGPEPASPFAYCGSGIELKGSDSVVRDSVVSVFGRYGITGAASATHNIVSGSIGPYSTGIEGLGEVAENTVTGSGTSYPLTRGINGAKTVKGNVVQSWDIGIDGTDIRDNTLINNEIGISGATKVSKNLIVAAQATYPNPACATAAPVCAPYSNIPDTLPTIGVDVGCADGSFTKENGLVGMGLAFANVDAQRPVPGDNLLANVTAVYTLCTN